MSKPILAVTDDHAIVRDGISNLLSSRGYTILHQCANGKELLKACAAKSPDIVLMDISMPEMDGYEATAALRIQFPEVKVIALTMLNTDMSLIKMIRAGAKSYVLKNSPITDLERAIQEVARSGFYSSDFVADRLIDSLGDNTAGKVNTVLDQFHARELEFLKLSCSELTYREIADKMCVSHRSVDGYRDSLFQKLGVKSRVGLAMFAVKFEVVTL